MEKNWTSWFEIPVVNLSRAKAFYEAIFGFEMPVTNFGVLQMAFFPQAKVGAALCAGPWYKPSTEGVLVYLNANPDLASVLDKVETAGGKILQAKKQISPDHGYMALIMDSEGNRMALHSLE